MLPFWFRNANPVIFLPCVVLATTLYLAYINWKLDGHWFLTFALPVSLSFGALIVAIVALLRYLRRGRLYIFGGGMTSKLFMNVREKMSLCYSIGSGYYGTKGIMTVSAGIDCQKEKVVTEEILRQLDLCRAGEITPEELHCAREAVRSSLRSVQDSPGSIEGYHFQSALTDPALTYEAYIAALDRVTAGDCSRMTGKEAEILFLLGADSSAIPNASPAPGLLSDHDRGLLAEQDILLSPRMEDKLRREMTIVYETCALPAQKLYVSWAASVGGEERSSSFLMERLRALFYLHYVGIPGYS